MGNIITVLVVATTALSGIAAGASLDVSIRQLPARHRIGVIAYSVDSQATAPCHGQDLVSPSGHWHPAACTCNSGGGFLPAHSPFACTANVSGCCLLDRASAHYPALGITNPTSPTPSRR